MSKGYSFLRNAAALCILVSFNILNASAQKITNSKINSYVNAANNIRQQLPIEKLYLQTDKPAYVQGDTIWFKAYLLNADFLTASQRSGLLYIELDDDNNQCIKRMLFPVAVGVGWGNIALAAADIPEGSYTLRAYTSWMRNFGEDYIFKKSLYIASAGDKARLVAAGFTQSKQAGKDNIRANMLISNINEQPLRLRDMQLRVLDGRHTLLKSTASTGVDGKMDINFNLPDNTGVKNLSVIAKDVTKDPEGKGTTLTIPIILNQPENTDLQFMPEGGTLVAGITSTVGFKAIGEDGKGADVSGKIYNSKQQEVAAFKSMHKGMGSFVLTPQAGESYIAELDLPGGKTKSYTLPVASLSGTGLSVSVYGADSLQVTLWATPDLLAAPDAYYLVGQSRGVICYGAQLTAKKTKTSLLVAKSLFPTGVARFTLFNAADQPLNERICYIDHQDNLRVNIVTDKNSFSPHDSIALKLQVTDKDGHPVRGSFSVAVTDDNQVKTDSTASNIGNALLLTADLKGTVEEPGYYFIDNSLQRTTELENLVLTQGWVGYGWKQVFGPMIKPPYAAEQDYTIQGTVTNVFNKPLAGTEVMMLSKKPSFAMDTLTDQHGRFTFKGFAPVDTAAFVMEAKNKRGKSFNVSITVDEFDPPVFTGTSGRLLPWYVNSDTLLMNSLNNRQLKHEAEIKLTGGYILNEVTIKAKKIIKGSKNLNDDGWADEVLDEADMEKAGKLTLLEVLQQKLNGFNEIVNRDFKLHLESVDFVIDGVNLDFFYQGNPGTARYQFLKTILENITAEDIKGIEALYNQSTKTRYDLQFHLPTYSILGYTDYSYIEVTTRSGAGALMKKTPGFYLYKPLAFSLPKQFYRPKYAEKNNKYLLPDLRSTIHWEPDIITDTAGKATVSFYSADKPSTYTIIVEGADLNGSVGYQRKKLLIH